MHQDNDVMIMIDVAGRMMVLKKYISTTAQDDSDKQPKNQKYLPWRRKDDSCQIASSHPQQHCICGTLHARPGLHLYLYLYFQFTYMDRMKQIVEGFVRK